jgi:hypothetical protein
MRDSHPVLAAQHPKTQQETREISPEEFVTIWQTSSSPEEAAGRCSVLAAEFVSTASVVNRASKYRRAGVALKKLSKS